MDEFDLLLRTSVDKTKRRLREFINYFGIDHVYISWSGGKDSEVLCHIARSIYPNIKIVFSNTGMELPEIIAHVLKRRSEGWNIDIVKPEKKFTYVWEKYGYPVISKSVSMAISRYRMTKSKKQKLYRLYGGTSKEGKKQVVGVIPQKFHRLAIEEKFKISDKCCDILKKNPLKKYGKKNNRYPIMATMAEESNQRRILYKKTGCNIFEGNNIMSKPMSFWETRTVWEYIKQNKIEISEIYTKHGYKRSGCYGCLFGCHMEKGENRIQKLYRTHPKLYKFLMEKMNYKEICKELNIKTDPINFPKEGKYDVMDNGEIQFKMFE